MEILTPAALFHDIIVYPKDHPKRFDSQIESSQKARKILENIT
jgi:HD superfamily phosphodiesterase